MSHLFQPIGAKAAGRREGIWNGERVKHFLPCSDKIHSLTPSYISVSFSLRPISPKLATLNGSCILYPVWALAQRVYLIYLVDLYARLSSPFWGTRGG